MTSTQPRTGSPSEVDGRTWRGLSPAERREARRARLLEAALEQFGTAGWAGTSLTGLCAAGGVSPRHFYELWPGREELLTELYDGLVLDTVAAVHAAQSAAEQTVQGQVLSGVGAVLTSLGEDPRRARIVLLEVVGVSPGLRDHRRRVIDAFADVVTDGHARLVAAGEVRAQPFRPLALALVGAVNELLSAWLLADPRPPLQELVPPLAQVFEAVFRS